MAHMGLRVIEERAVQGLTQEELAERVGLSRRQMNRVEAGTANIGLKTLLRLSSVLMIKPAQLFDQPMKTTVRRHGRPPNKRKTSR